MLDDCAICLFFDGETEDRVRELWGHLAGAGITSEMPDAGWRPHITLAGCDRLDISRYEPALHEFASAQPGLPVVLSSVGCFLSPNSTLFLAPTMTQELMDLHVRHQAMATKFSGRMSGYYLPGNWVPHCTLGLNLSPESLVKSVGVCQSECRLPLVGQLQEIGVVQVKRPQVVPVCCFPLG
jgi:2'-5' RNA ligase